jgi:hypothetical protein
MFVLFLSHYFGPFLAVLGLRCKLAIYLLHIILLCLCRVMRARIASRHFFCITSVASCVIAPWKLNSAASCSLSHLLGEVNLM